MVESVDTTDLKSVGGNSVGVQVPPSLLPLYEYNHTLGGPTYLHNIMHESSLNLFCDHCDDLDIDNAFMLAMEEEAAKLEITVDYYMEEFMWYGEGVCPKSYTVSN